MKKRNKIDYDLTNKLDDRSTDQCSYLSSLFSLVLLMYGELTKFLDEEGRNFGIMISYKMSLDSARDKFLEEDETEETVIKRTYYTYRNIVRREFDKLTSRHLSKADSTICIMRKMVHILSEHKGFEHEKEVYVFQKTLDKLYNNINFWAKQENFIKLGNTLRKSIISCKIGKYEIDGFSIQRDRPEKIEIAKPIEEINKIYEEIIIKDIDC